MRVKVQAARRGGGEATADFAVVAVPAPLAAAFEWAPRLPKPQHDAIARLKYGFATKTLLQFERRFWNVPGRARAFGTDLAVGAVWDAAEEQPGEAGILALLPKWPRWLRGPEGPALHVTHDSLSADYRLLATDSGLRAISNTPPSHPPSSSPPSRP